MTVVGASAPFCRALVVSDGPILRAGLLSLAADAGAEVVAEVDTPAGLDEIAESSGAQVVLAAPVAGDGEDFYAALRHMRTKRPALVMLAVPGYRMRAGTLRRRHGLSAVPLDVCASDLHHALRAVLAPDGNAPLAVEELCIGPGGVLSLREQEVLRELADGLGNQAIADRLYVSQATVKSHLRTIYRKLGVRTRSEAVARYISAFGSS